MRIFSKFRDYYDLCRGLGSDPKIVFLRETKKIYVDDLKPNEIQVINPLLKIFKAMPCLDNYSRHKSGIIVFCGKAYPFYLWENKSYYQFDKLRVDLTSYCKTKNSVYSRSQLSSINRKIPKKYLKLGRQSLNIDSWNYFNETIDTTIPNSIHRFFKSPILVKLHDKIIVNPILSNYSFENRVDPYSAYQEISMYMGNNLVVQLDPDIDIPDKLKIESRGFNKWSFRKHKSDN